MPVTVLLVEGELDSQILSRILQPGPTIELGGAKGSLAPKARDRRADKRVYACYLRDRDFDHEPPADRSAPCVDSYAGKPDEGGVLGWRWCRHAIESYLLEPQAVAEATKWTVEEFTAALIDAGRRIAEYTAVRWTLGQVRRRIAEVRHVGTRPQPKQNEIWLPADLSLETNVRAAAESLAAWRDQTVVPDAATISEECRARAARLAGLSVVEEVLVWHSGKDLLAALKEPIQRELRIDPHGFRKRVRDWVRDNADVAIKLFPEWAVLRRILGGE